MDQFLRPTVFSTSSPRLFSQKMGVAGTRLQFFSAKNYFQRAITKTKSATIAFFLFSSLFLLVLSFFFVTVILELLGLEKPTF